MTVIYGAGVGVGLVFGGLCGGFRVLHELCEDRGTPRIETRLCVKNRARIRARLRLRLRLGGGVAGSVLVD